MRQSVLTYMILLVAVCLLAVGLVARHIVQKPEDMIGISRTRYSMIISGVPPCVRLMLHGVSAVVFSCAFGLYFYIDRPRNFACENDIVHYRRHSRVYQYLVATAGAINLGQAILAVAGLLSVQHIEYAHILHSRLFAYLGCFIGCLWFFVTTRGYIAKFRTVPPEIILASKQRENRLP